jgi:hypothetical protein
MLGQTSYIHLASAENFLWAAGYAGQIGAPLNRFLTISWKNVCVPERVLDVQREVLQLASKWLRYREVIPAYVWVIENGYRHGHHSHIAIHVPQDLKQHFLTMVAQWVKRGSGSNFLARGAVSMSEDDHKRKNYHKSKRDLFRYMLKGCELEAAKLLNIKPDYEKAGDVAGKRSGFSQNLGPAARGKRSQKSRLATLTASPLFPPIRVV